MESNESKRISSSSSWYQEEQLDFDIRMIGFRYKSIRQYLKGPFGLELGPAEGQMTRFLKDDFKHLIVVDGASDLLDLIPDYSNVEKIHCLFENFKPDKKFETIIMEHILEHVEDPVRLIATAREWLAPGGNMILGVPNGQSFHRLAAVKMRLLDNPCQLNGRDIKLGHRRVYTPGTFRQDIHAAGMNIVEIGGVFLKPLSNQQIQDSWSDEMINAFYELGKDFAEFCAEIFAVCKLK